MKKPLYVFKDVELRRHQGSFRLDPKKEDEEPVYVPVNGVSEIMVFGKAELNRSFLNFLNKNSIPLHFYGYFEGYLGTFLPRSRKEEGGVLLAQCKHYLSYPRRMDLARRFVAGSMRNLEVNLKYFSRTGTDLDRQCGVITELRHKVKEETNLGYLMALEGNAREAYYSGIRVLAEKAGFEFASRIKRPPDGPFNAMLSFGNVVLYNHILTAIYQAGLHPAIGYLHATNKRKCTLNLDIAEIFKPLIVDRAIIAMLNRKQVNEKDFLKKGVIIRMKTEARKNFIREMEKKLHSTVKLPNGTSRSLEEVIKAECRKVRRHLLNESVYEPYKGTW